MGQKLRSLILLLLLSFTTVAYAVDYTADVNCFGAWLMEIDEDPLTDSSGEGHTGALTAAGNPDFDNADPPAAYTTGYYVFDGANDHVICGDIQELDDATEMSFVTWVYHESITSDDLMYAKMSGASNDGILFWRDDEGPADDDIYRVFVAENGTASNWSLESVVNASPLQTWTHVAFTLKADTAATGLALYINGVEDANSPTGTADLDSWDAGAQDVWLGEDDEGTRDFHGRMDEPAVFNDVLTLVEINAIMDNGLEGAAAAAAENKFYNCTLYNGIFQ